MKHTPDLVAGLTLAAYLLPAGIGDASLAGLPPETGLYACLFSGLEPDEHRLRKEADRGVLLRHERVHGTLEAGQTVHTILAERDHAAA